MKDDKIIAARIALGRFIRERREEMGHDLSAIAGAAGIASNTLDRIEQGRFAWDIDLHFRLCRELEIKPYYSVSHPDPLQEDWRTRREDDPERYHGFYMCDNLLLYSDQAAIVKLTHPRLFVRFNYGESQFIDYDDWKNNITVQEWLDADDKPTDRDEIDTHLTDCWNFLALHEREEERLYEEDEDEDDDYA